LLVEADRPVRVGSRALMILSVLVERAGELVAKDELMKRVWPNTFVEDGSIRVHIAALRRALGHGTGTGRFIGTVAGRGYQFLAPVSARVAAASELARDLREVARHSSEEVLSSEDSGEHGAFVIRAFDFAFIGEEVARQAMLPTPEELRERSRQLREAARKTTDDTAKRRLVADALILAQVAEGIERERGGSGDKVETYKWLLAGVLGH
jgi:DNA-binding winged helix-turn-helix (wHTH) protein